MVSGSTRLKAGTATKLILNRITTISMIQIGKVYDNLMVDLNISNQKLVKRSVRIVSQLTGLSQDKAKYLIEQANGEVKTAIVMYHQQCDYSKAKMLLETCGGHLRKALSQLNK